MIIPSMRRRFIGEERMMAVLLHKLRRDLRASIATLTTVIAIISVGTGSFISFGSAQRCLQASKDSYYRQYRMADFWISVKKAPLSVVDRITLMPQVSNVEPRVVQDVILDLPGIIRPLTGRLISAPTIGFDRTINGICLVRGGGFSDERDEEVIIGEAFAQAHGLRPGDSVSMILNQRRVSCVIVGTAISPEYVYMVQGEGDLLPDPEHFGILYIKERYARDVLDFRSACNQIVGLLSPQFEQHGETVLRQLEDILAPYGVLATTPRSRQASNRFLSDEIAGLTATAVIVPSIFLCVAALVLNILMSRLAQRQRTIIGTLKALGYSDRSIMLHFLSFGTAVGVLGGLVGNGIGIAGGAGLLAMYRMFYQFPRFDYQIQYDLMLLGLIISVLFAMIGTVKGVRLVLRLRPAEAMRPTPPERGGAIVLERWNILWNRLGFRSHMALRSVFRHRGRTLTGILSSMLASAIIVLSMSMYESVDFLVEFQFNHVARSDADIGLREAVSRAALLEAQRLPGVDEAEPIFGLVCEVRYGSQSRRMSITGLARHHRLTTPMRSDLTPIEIPNHGIVMSRKLAEIFGVQIGDTLVMTPVRGRRIPVSVHLASVVDSYLGLDCYADVGYLSAVVGESQALNAIQLKVDPSKHSAFYAAVKQLPNVSGLSVRADTIRNLKDTFVKTMLVSLGILILFAGVISLGSTLNAMLIEIGDRTREISTLRVMGYTTGQVAGIFFRQNVFIAGVGYILAIPFGYGLCRLTSQAYNTELYRMPVVFNATIVAIAGGIISIFVLMAQWVALRHIGMMNWQEGIKVKE